MSGQGCLHCPPCPRRFLARMAWEKSENVTIALFVPGINTLHRASMPTASNAKESVMWHTCGLPPAVHCGPKYTLEMTLRTAALLLQS